MSIEEKIVKFQKTNDEYIYEEILERFTPMIHSMTQKYNRHFYYEDIIQDQRLMLLECMKKFDISKGYKFSTYFWTSMSGHIKQQWAIYSNYKWGSDCPPEHVEIDDTFMAKNVDIDRILDVDRMIDGLPNEEKSVITKYYMEGKRVEDIAASINKSPTQTYSIMKSALLKLRRKYE